MSEQREDVIYIPVPRRLNNNLVRLTDGQMDASKLAGDLIEEWIVYSLDDGIHDLFGDRAMEAAEIYAPHLAKQWLEKDKLALSKYEKKNKPLVWKELSLRPGTEVRMTYDGVQHYAAVKEGFIEDDDGAFSPSQWASKVADGTTRNAWRDLWFKEPFAKTWVPAEMMRSQAKEDLLRQTSAKHNPR